MRALDLFHQNEYFAFTNSVESYPFQVAGMLGMQELNADEMTRKLEDMLPVIRQVNEQFRDPVCAFAYSFIKCIFEDDDCV